MEGSTHFELVSSVKNHNAWFIEFSLKILLFSGIILTTFNILNATNSNCNWLPTCQYKKVIISFLICVNASSWIIWFCYQIATFFEMFTVTFLKGHSQICLQNWIQIATPIHPSLNNSTSLLNWNQQTIFYTICNN